MTRQEKIRVAVLYGGRSGEHEVSIRSATSVVNNLDRALFEIIPIGIDKKGAWLLGSDPQNGVLPAPDQLRLTHVDNRMLFAPTIIGQQQVSVLDELKNKDHLFDVIFPVIHGSLCEDGTVQGLLELANVPYVGCGVLSSAVGMDKDVAKRLALQAGITVPPYLSFSQGKWQTQSLEICRLIENQLSLPLFVKPSNTGSSLGITKVKDFSDLKAAISHAFKFDIKVLVEQGIDAIELELSVLEALEYGEEPFVSIAGEIRPLNKHEFYTYEAKYLDENGAALFIPAPISEELQSKAKQMAKELFQILECEGMARVDLFLERGTDRLLFNEINTIPGFTSISMYPKLIEASGIPYQKLLTHLVRLALSRFERKKHLVRDFVASD